MLFGHGRNRHRDVAGRVDQNQRLITAAQTGDLADLQAALDAGASVNYQLASGVTALIHAAASRQRDAVRLLLRKGADPNIRTYEGYLAYDFSKNQNDHETAALLLGAHGGRPPGISLTGRIGPPPPSNDPLDRWSVIYNNIYWDLYTREAILERRFYNIGSGVWRHPYWTNVDYDSDWYRYHHDMIDIGWDISTLEPIPVEDATAELVYSSHTVEHLTPEQDAFLFREMHRILKPDGVFRVTCPNIDLYYQAYKRRDIFVNFQYGHDYPFGQHGSYDPDAMSIWLVNEIASQLVHPSFTGHQPRYAGRQNELDALLASKPMEQAFDELIAQIDYEVQRRAPGNHVNWWTNEKMCRELRKAGFSQAVTSVAGGSVAAVMRDRKHFDTVSPTFSLFVDGIK